MTKTYNHTCAQCGRIILAFEEMKLKNLHYHRDCYHLGLYDENPDEEIL